MKKIYIAITGSAEGQETTITRQIEVPEFQVKTNRKLSGMDYKLPDQSIEEQEIKHIEDNYEKLVWEQVYDQLDAVFDYEILGSSLLPTTLQDHKIAKISAIYTNAIGNSKSKDFRNDFIATLTRMWPAVKDLKVEKIAEIVLYAQNIGYDVATEVLKKINNSLNETLKPSKYKQLKKGRNELK